ncbi:MAG TPA: AMMECR1 domain-containing protein [Stenomitos sp.]
MHRMLAILLCFLALAQGAKALPLEAYQHDRMLAKEAHAIAMHAAHDYLFRGIKPTNNRMVNDRRLKVPGGVFVTITRDGKTRGCWGTVQPERATLAEQIAVAAVKALRYDYRHQPISRSEWPELRFYVSLVGPMTPVSSPAALSPLRQGLFVTAGGKGGVLLPGEAKTARYQLAECRKKAGLRPRERVMMYRFNTVVFGPESENL